MAGWPAPNTVYATTHATLISVAVGMPHQPLGACEAGGLSASFGGLTGVNERPTRAPWLGNSARF